MVKLFAEYQLYLKAAGHLSWRRGGGEVHPPTSSPEYWPVFKTRAQAWVRIVRKRVSNLKVKVFGQSRLRLFVEGIITANPLLIPPPHSNKPPLFRVGKLMSPPSLLSPPPLPFPLPPIFILDKKITINVDWSVMVYSGWKFVFGLRPHDLQLHMLNLANFAL